MNGENLTHDDALKWLQGQGTSCRNIEMPFKRRNLDIQTKDNSTTAFHSDLVIISLQECPTPPTENNRNFGDEATRGIPCIKTFTSSNSSADDKVQETLSSFLSSDHYLLADIAMGEPASPKGYGKAIKWYGYIRLILFARRTLIDEIYTRNGPYLIPIMAPAGRKTGDSSTQQYPQNRSPDKGGVCIAIPALSLLICSVHLCGTNSYNTPEAHFDAFRIYELNIIAEECQKVLACANTDNHYSPANGSCIKTYHPVICGDLNFRVEMFSNCEDKSRGGKDFKAVHDILGQGSFKSVRELFLSHDRLVQLMRYLYQDEENSRSGESPFTNLSESAKDLLNVRDVFMEWYKEHEGCEILYPTFTFQMDGNYLQKWTYSDKRTPSWTDRILVCGSLLRNSFGTTGQKLVCIGASFNVRTSDHVPVFAALSSD